MFSVFPGFFFSDGEGDEMIVRVAMIILDSVVFALIPEPCCGTHRTGPVPLQALPARGWLYSFLHQHCRMALCVEGPLCDMFAVRHC